MDVEGSIELPKMVIYAKKVDITADITLQRMSLAWNSSQERFNITATGPEIKINVATTLIPIPMAPTVTAVDLKLLYTAKLAGALLAAIEWTYSDGSTYSRLYPYDPSTDTIWVFDMSIPGNHWARAKVDLFGEWDNSGTNTLPAGWSSSVKNNGLPTNDP